MTTPTISYGHGTLQDLTTTTGWTAGGEAGATCTFSCLNDDVFSLYLAPAGGAKVCYVKNDTDIDISPNTYPKVIIRYKTSDATIKAKVVIEDDTAATQTVLAESSSTTWKTVTATLTLTGQIDHITLYVKGTTGTVYYDFVLICKGQFPFPSISNTVSLDMSPRNVQIPIPGRVGDITQNLGSPSCPIHVSGEMDSSTGWQGTNSVVGEILYDIAQNSYVEPWQWFTSDVADLKVTLESCMLSQVSNVNAQRAFDIILKEYRGCSGSNETYAERFGLG